MILSRHSLPLTGTQTHSLFHSWGLCLDSLGRQNSFLASIPPAWGQLIFLKNLLQMPLLWRVIKSCLCSPQCCLLSSPPHCIMVSRSDATPCKTATRAALATGRFVLSEGEWAPLLTGLFGLGLFIGPFLLIGCHCNLSLFKGIWCQIPCPSDFCLLIRLT